MKNIIFSLIFLFSPVCVSAFPSAPQAVGSFDEIKQSASTTYSGTVEIATATETNTGTDATRCVSPNAIEGWEGSTNLKTLKGVADTEKIPISIAQPSTLGDTGALTPTAGYDFVEISQTCSANPSAIVMTEGGSEVNNSVVRITNVGSNVCTFAYNSGVLEHNGGDGKSLSLSQYRAIVLQYKTDRWVVISNQSDTLFIESITLPAYAHFANADAVYNDITTPHVLIAAETKNAILTNYGATEDRVYTSLAAEFGMNFMMQIGAAYQVDLEPHPGEALWLNGTKMATDEHIVNAGDTEGEVMSCWSVESANEVCEIHCKSSYINFAEATP